MSEDHQVKFAHSPSDAVQCLLDLKDGMKRTREAGLQGTLIRSNQDWSLWESFIENIELFYWSSETAAVVTEASKSYPLEPEEAINVDNLRKRQQAGELIALPSYLPQRKRGLCVFEQPCLFVTADNRTLPLSALGWRVERHGASGDDWLSIRGVIWTPQGAFVVWWSDGGSAGSRDHTVHETYPTERLTFTK